MKVSKMFDPIMLERFWSKVERTSTCWNWKGTKDKNGYGQIKINKKLYRSSRVSYQISKGEIPKNKTIIQSCKNHSCVNPNHLIAGSQINQNTKKTHCPKGHEFSGLNNQGKRICRTCQNKTMNLRYHNKIGNKEYQLNYQATHKDSVNANTRKWHRNNKAYFTNWDKANPRSGSHYPIDERHAMTERLLIDKKTCQWARCDSKVSVAVHHIFPRNEYPNVPVITPYLISYCKKHHAEFHKARGDPYWNWIASQTGNYNDF